jgi:hypothetical protein
LSRIGAPKTSGMAIREEKNKGREEQGKRGTRKARNKGS